MLLDAALLLRTVAATSQHIVGPLRHLDVNSLDGLNVKLVLGTKAGYGVIVSIVTCCITTGVLEIRRLSFS